VRLELLQVRHRPVLGREYEKLFDYWSLYPRANSSGGRSSPVLQHSTGNRAPAHARIFIQETNVARSSVSALALLATSLCLPAAAENYPTQPIKFIVPFTPGTGMDSIARAVGPKLAERLGQPVVVENKPGASGNIGASSVAKAAPDGHTLMVTANTLLIASNLYPSVPFQPLNDFAPISLAAWGTLLLASSPKSNLTNVPDLLAQARAKPGKFTYGSPGIGTPHHMAMEMFKDLTGTDLLHVPYKGTAGAVTDLLSGELDIMFLPVHVAMPHVKAQKLKGLAVGSSKRHPVAADLPTLQELGVKGADVDMWYAFLAPKATPASIIARLNTELRAILALPDIRSVLETQGLEAASSNPQELKERMQRDYARWGEIIRKNNIRAD
jgi:tripartite-type tricarboxylate transporter receptor subunit TctC